MTAHSANGGAGELVLAAVGDCLIDVEDQRAPFADTAALFRSADIAFANSEGPYTSRPSRPPGSGVCLAVDPKNAAAFSHGGFTVLNCATNHVFDGGYEGLLDTLETFQSQGIATIGAGRNVEEAHRPAFVTRNGVTVAFLGYASVFLTGSEARVDMPGLALARVHTIYATPMPHLWNPAAIPDIVTVPHPPDLAALQRDIAQARAQADYVVVSFHWGDAGKHSGIDEYERVLGHATIDAGADVVLAHHRHNLRAVELYRGKPIFYSLGAFALYLPNFDERPPKSVKRKMGEHLGEHAVAFRPEYPTFPFHAECRMTAIARVAFEAGRVSSVGLVPCYVQPDGHPRPCTLSSEQGRQILEYLRQAARDAGVATRFGLEDGGALGDYAAIAVTAGDGA